ncbi:hypothetical protein DF182_03495 [Chitinophaga flava]|uniref:Uncharacterized protein n=1 Tax=Chitinophaga flava TaxID=2259036 RepID=A0A365Y041_9BACT|nr:hypothetical protein DF182_03495 [Chitinophaga flava]
MITKGFLFIPYKSNIEKQLDYIKHTSTFQEINSRTTKSKTIYKTKAITIDSFCNSCDSIIVGLLVSSDSSVIEQKSYKVLRTFVEYHCPSAEIMNAHYGKLMTALKKNYKFSRNITLGDETTAIEERFDGLEFRTSESVIIPYIGIYKSNMKNQSVLLLEYGQPSSD